MRLWHYELIPFLPKSQLLAQWRELNSIFKKQDRHILINYIYEYPKEKLFRYSLMVFWEMRNRDYKAELNENMENYFGPALFRIGCFYYIIDHDNPFPEHHTDRYLLQCYYNLQEKHDRGQKDFDNLTFSRLEDFITERFADKELLKERIC